jgi:hypothetical protein
MAFLKVNCIGPVESIPVSSLLLFFHGYFKVFATLLELLVCDYSALSCVFVNSFSQTIVNIAILKHIVVHESELKEIFFWFRIYWHRYPELLSSDIRKHFH